VKSPLVSLSENQVGQIDLFEAERTKNGCIPSDKISVATWQRSRAASLWRPFGPYIQLLRHHIPIILFPSYSLGSTKKIPMNHSHEIPWLPHMFTGPVLLVTSTVHPAYVDNCTLITWILPQRWPISFYIPIDIIIFLAFSSVPSISPAFSPGLPPAPSTSKPVPGGQWPACIRVRRRWLAAEWTAPPSGFHRSLNIPSPVPTTLATLVFRQFCRLLICLVIIHEH